MKGARAIGKPRRGVCVGCGCTHSTPCISYFGEACHWVDKKKTVCSSCFSPLGYSSADDNVKAIRRATSVPLLERCLDIFKLEDSKTRAKAVEIRLRALTKGNG